MSTVNHFSLVVKIPSDLWDRYGIFTIDGSYGDEAFGVQTMLGTVCGGEIYRFICRGMPLLKSPGKEDPLA